MQALALLLQKIRLQRQTADLTLARTTFCNQQPELGFLQSAAQRFRCRKLCAIQGVTGRLFNIAVQLQYGF